MVLNKNKVQVSEWVFITSIGFIIKPTLGILGMLMVFFISLKSQKLTAYAFTGLFVIIFIAKDVYSSGYILFPSSEAIGTNVEWQIPKEIYQLEYEKIKAGSYEQINSHNNYSIYTGLFKNKLKSILAWLVIFLVIASAVQVFRKRISKNTLFILLIFLLIWSQSPHFRLGMHVFIPIGALVINSFNISRVKYSKRLEYVALVGLFIVLIIPSINLEQVVSNPQYQSIKSFKLANIIIPDKKKMIKFFERTSKNGIGYREPQSKTYCWHQCFPCRIIIEPFISSDGNVYNLCLIGNEPKDGFKWEKENVNIE